MLNEEVGTRTEIKNLNSIKHLESAINVEISRQKNILINRGKITKKTLTFDEKQM